MTSRHVKALQDYANTNGRDMGQADWMAVLDAADHITALEAQLRIARRALREFKHGKHRCGSEAASEAASVLAAMRQAAKGTK